MRRSQSHNSPLSAEGTPLVPGLHYGRGQGQGQDYKYRAASRPDIITDYEREDYYDDFPERAYPYSEHGDSAHSSHFKGYLHDLPPYPNDESLANDDAESTDSHAVLELISVVVENIVSHPFIILRRQCQVHDDPRRLHVMPTSLPAVCFHLIRRRGPKCFWKGFGSACLVRGIASGVETAISSVTRWPKDLNGCEKAGEFWRHISLKCLSIAIVAPFYAAALIDTVESDNFKLDGAGPLEVIRGGCARLFSWGVTGKNKMLPIYAIAIPTVAYGIARYVFDISIKSTISRILTFRQKHLQTKESPAEIDSESSFAAMMITEVVFFPLETIIHRLFLQGTRTIIDDLYNGYSVLPILTTYEGFFDCYQSIVIREGFGGLYKGFGTLVIQFAALKLVRYLIFSPQVAASVQWLQRMKLPQSGPQ